LPRQKVLQNLRKRVKLWHGGKSNCPNHIVACCWETLQVDEG
jgi:hypothetical protein